MPIPALATPTTPYSLRDPRKVVLDFRAVAKDIEENGEPCAPLDQRFVALRGVIWKPFFGTILWKYGRARADALNW